MKQNKKRMSSKKLLSIWLPCLAVLVAMLIAGNLVAGYYASALDTFLGGGQRIVEGGDANVDSNYYTNPFENEANPNRAAVAYASKISEKVADEGFVLMKNNGLLPLASGTTLTPFGYRYLYPAYTIWGSGSMYGGTGSNTGDNLLAYFGGSGGTAKNKPSDFKMVGDHVVTLDAALMSTFTLNTATIDAMNAAEPVQLIEATGTTPVTMTLGPGACTGANTVLYEYPISVYESAKGSMAGTVGIVVIARDAGEGGDLKHDAYADGTPHELAPTQNERDTIAYAKANCDSVIVLINSCNVMELSPLMSGEYEADAILWIGYPGSAGFASLPKILTGEVNPSGRTVDTWPVDLTKDPTYQNIAANYYTNAQAYLNGGGKVGMFDAPFVEYEEGVYVGYKYYETAAVEDPSFDYDKAVVFPFGYGLSYTTFTQKIVDLVENGDEVTVTVQVENTGNQDGMEVVQLYYTAPYTDWDKNLNIEKPVKNLLNFAKVAVKAGASETVTITFCKEDMASYCYTRQNPDGTYGAYVLEGGEYVITLGKNSHDEWETRTVSVEEEWFDSTNPRQSEIDGQSLLNEDGTPSGTPENGGETFVAASNRFADTTDYMTSGKATLLSRKDWTGTFPTAPTDADKTASETVKNDLLAYGIGSFDYENDPELGNVPTSKIYEAEAPVSKATNGLSVIHLRGKDYYDEDWEKLLDQIDYSDTDQINHLLFEAGYNTSALDSIGLFATVNNEGPSGFGLFTRMSWREQVSCGYPSGAVIASTWNRERAHDVGEAQAYEAMNVYSDHYINGWTGPAMNLHRSPFGGRAAEYYSEDALLSGMIGVQLINGAGDNGLYTIFKHFALNDTDTERWGVATWADEQTIRETYLKTFEIVFKEGRKTLRYYDEDAGEMKTRVMRSGTGVMTSMNRIGAIPAGSHYGLITEILHNEWGFNGIVQTDMPTQSDRDMMLRSGSDMQMVTSLEGTARDMTSPTVQHQIRRAIHDVAYAVVNSSATQGMDPSTTIRYTMSPWKLALTIVTIVLSILSAAAVVLLFLRVFDEKKHPEAYRA